MPPVPRHSHAHMPACGRSWCGHGGVLPATQGHTRQRRKTIVNLHRALDTQLAPVLTTPEDVTLECLTLLRRPHVLQLMSYLVPAPAEDDAAQSPQQRLPLVTHMGTLQVEHQGPLASCAHVMDAAARRVLPRHLLRRCRILSSLQLGDTCRQRVAVTARSGEEAVFVWQLQRTPPETHSEAVPAARTHNSAEDRAGLDGAYSTLVASAGTARIQQVGDTATPATATTSSDSDDENIAAVRSAHWRVQGIQRDTTLDTEPISGGPHPRAREACADAELCRQLCCRFSPETVVLQQLRKLSQGNLLGAAAFMDHSDQGSSHPLSHLRSMVRSTEFSALLTHTSASLVTAALPSDRSFWQLVQLTTPSDNSSYVWQLRLQSSGCWVVSEIVKVS